MKQEFSPPVESPSRGEFLQAAPHGASRDVRRLNSADLLTGAREVLIEHSGACYRLRVTQNDKLILTK